MSLIEAVRSRSLRLRLADAARPLRHARQPVYGLDRLSLREVCRQLKQLGCRRGAGAMHWHASTIRGCLPIPPVSDTPLSDPSAACHHHNRGCG